MHHADGGTPGPQEAARTLPSAPDADPGVLELLQRSEERFRATFEQAAVGMAHVGLSGQWLRVNRRLCEIVGYSRQELQDLTFQDITHPDDLAIDLGQAERLAAGRIESYSMEKRYIRRDGSVVWVNLTGSCVRDGEGRPEYHIAVVEDIDSRKRAEESLDFIAEAGRLLASSLDIDTVLNTLLRLAVPRLGDYAVIDLLDDGNTVSEWRTAHVLPEKARLAEAYRRRYPPGVRNPRTPIWRAMQTGETMVANDLPPSFVDEVARDAEQARLLHALRPRSFIITPLKARGRTVGAMSFCVSESDRRYDGRDETLARELAGRAAVAIENARLHRHVQDELRAVSEARAWTERLQSLTSAFVRALRHEDVGVVVTGQMREAVGAVAGGLLLLSPDGRELEMVHVTGWERHEDVVSAWRTFPATPGIPAVDAMESGSILTIESMDEFRARYPEIAPLMERVGYPAYAVIPLEIDGRPIGALNYNFAEDHRFTDEERSFLTVLGRQASQAINRTNLFAAEAEARRLAEAASVQAEAAREEARAAYTEAAATRDEATRLAESLEEVNHELVRTVAAAEAANRAKSEFLGMMSHELRTPLNAILGYAQLLELGIYGPLTDEQRQQLDRIQRSQRHLVGIVDGILAYQKVEAGQVVYSMEDVSLREVMSEVVALIEPMRRASGVELTAEDTACEASVRADREKLQQVLLNLVANAVKFTPEGGRVWIDCVDLADGVAVRVHDSGIGIPAEMLELIFEPFVQLDMRLTRGHGGTGLGLAISRKFMQAMGGDVTVTSVPDQGSVFVLSLPRSRK
jgi:PAS domain S-box-containing protein